MRRIRREETKVWHSPEIVAEASRRGAALGCAEDAREARQHHAALEALFRHGGAREPPQTPRRLDGSVEAAPSTTDGSVEAAPSTTKGAKVRRRPADGALIVSAPSPDRDPKAVQLQRLVSRLLAAEGRVRITRAANDLLRAGFALPDDQDVYLQLLEHSDEARVSGAIDAMATLLAGEPPKRRAILESRLRRLEEYAEELSTRSAAEHLRRHVTGAR